MGRVARYKKVKAFDAFAKNSVKERSGLLPILNQTRKKKRSPSWKKKKKNAPDKPFYDLPPDHCDDFDLNDPDFSVKKQKELELPEVDMKIGDNCVSKMEAQNDAAVMPLSLKEEAKEARILRMDSRSFQFKSSAMNKNPEKAVKKEEWETMDQFRARLQQETVAACKKDSSKMKKKKEYFHKKKNKRKKLNQDEESVHVSKSRSSFSYYQVERPPKLQVLPKGAPKKVHNSLKNDDSLLAKQRALEMMREKVQSQYKLMKARRANGGSFHL